MIKVISINVNGLRAAIRKGLLDWLRTLEADVICLQEIKCYAEQVADLQTKLANYQSYFLSAAKPGYSGVALLSKIPIHGAPRTLSWELAHHEGRYLEIDLGKVKIASIYLPSGSSGPHRQQQKFHFMEQFVDDLKNMGRDPTPYILCGDWNIAHQTMDLKNWRSNQKNSGFLPEERAWLERLFSEQGWVDSYRKLHPDRIAYSWWSSRGRARENNVGWRIDYQIVSPHLADQILSAEMDSEPNFSDHAALIHCYDL